MAKERVAVVGVGQTKHQATRGDVSMAGLVREAALRALDDAEHDVERHRRRRHRQGPRLLRGRDDARAVPGRRARARSASRCSACTPPGRSAGRPPSSRRSWCRPASTSGCSRSPSRSSRRARPCGPCRSRCRSPRRSTPERGGYFAPHVRSYMARSGSPDHIGILVALKDRQNALKNPYAHLHEHDITFDSIKDSMMLWDPIRYAETCPSSDGACAMVLGQRGRRRRARTGRWPGCRARPCAREPTMSADRDTVLPRGGGRVRGRRLQAGRDHRSAPRGRLRGDVRALLLVRADVAREPRLRGARARAGSSWRTASRSSTATSR